MSKAAVLHRTPYDGLQADISHSSGLLCEDPSLAIQEAKDSCDLNVIMARYTRTGELAHFHSLNPMFGDFSTVPSDLSSSLNSIIAAQSSFDSLPASVRKRFDNDPVSFFNFCLDESNLSELSQLGLLSPEADARLKESSLAPRLKKSAVGAEGDDTAPKVPSSSSSSKTSVSKRLNPKASSEDSD